MFYLRLILVGFLLIKQAKCSLKSQENWSVPYPANNLKSTNFQSQEDNQPENSTFNRQIHDSLFDDSKETSFVRHLPLEKVNANLIERKSINILPINHIKLNSAQQIQTNQKNFNGLPLNLWLNSSKPKSERNYQLDSTWYTLPRELLYGSNTVKLPQVIPIKLTATTKIAPKILTIRRKSLDNFLANEFDRSDNHYHTTEFIPASISQASLKSSIYESPIEERHTRYTDDEIGLNGGQWGRPMMAASKHSGIFSYPEPVYYATAAAAYPPSLMGHKMILHPRSGLEKSALTVPILVGIAAALVSFVAITNLFLSIPLLAMTLMQLFNGNNNNMVMPSNNNGNNNQAPLPSNQNGKRKRRDAQLELKILQAIEKFD